MCVCVGNLGGGGGLNLFFRAEIPTKFKKYYTSYNYFSDRSLIPILTCVIFSVPSMPQLNFMFVSPGELISAKHTVYLRMGNGVGKQGYGNRPPSDDRNPIRKFSIDPLCLQNQCDNSASIDSPQQRIKEKSRYGNSVLTLHRLYGHRLRTPFLRIPFSRLLFENFTAHSKCYLHMSELLKKVVK